MTDDGLEARCQLAPRLQSVTGSRRDPGAERDGTGHDDAVQLARAVSAVTFLAMAATTTPDVDAVMGDIEAQVRAVLRR